MSHNDEIRCPCFGWAREYGVGLPGEVHHRNCKLWSREHKGAEVHATKTELIVLGEPDDNDESHNCDAMGCGTFSHVLFRFPLPSGVGEAFATDSRCTYSARVGGICNKCGRIHDGKPNPSVPLGVPMIAEAPSGGVTWTPEDEARLDAAIARRAAARACPICGPNIPLPGEQCTRERGCAIAGVEDRKP